MIKKTVICAKIRYIYLRNFERKMKSFGAAGDPPILLRHQNSRGKPAPYGPYYLRVPLSFIMLSRSVRSVLLRSKIGSRVTVGASFPRALNNLKVVSHFRLQSVQAFSTGKAKEEEPATNGEAGEAKKESAVAKYDYDEHDDYEYDENMTSSQKVRIAHRKLLLKIRVRIKVETYYFLVISSLGQTLCWPRLPFVAAGCRHCVRGLHRQRTVPWPNEPQQLVL